MSIANKLTYLNTTKGKIKDSINLTGAGITNEDTFRSYATKLRDGLVQVLNDNGETLYNNFPKVSGSGSEITLENTLEAPMKNGTIDGDTFQQTKILPNEYTQVDYIDNTGVEYINTGVIGKKNLKVYIELNMKSLPSGNHPVSGCYGNNQRCYLGIINSSGILGYSYDTTTWSSTSISINQKNIIEIDFTQNSQSMKLNGTSILTTTSSVDMNTNQNILLFGYNNDDSFDTRFPILYKLYRYKIYDNNVLIRDFIPCYRNSDNEVGMYDLVNNVFYTNQGTGSFTYGSVVSIPNPDYPQEIQSVEGIQNITIGDGTSSQNYEVNLGTIKLYDGDKIVGTPDNWSIVRNWKSIILDTSQITLGSSYSNIEYAKYTKATDYLGYGVFTPYEIVCSKASYSTSPSSWDNANNVNKIYGSAERWFWWIGFAKGTGLTTIQQKLANTEIVYPLTTPTTEQITDTYLISQLNALYNAKSYNGQTNISVSGNLPMILEVSALKDEI